MNELIVENNPAEIGSVAAWQNILNGCGFNPELIITGYMDDATVAATQAFQHDVGFPGTGEVNLATWQAGLAYKKLKDWSDATPLISIRRNSDPATGVVWSTGSATATQWSKKELTNNLTAEAQKQDLPLKTQWAYMMATIEWETAHTFEPVREAFWLGESWRKKHLRYYPYYGRGYVQLTFKDNYQKYKGITSLDLVNKPDLAMKPDVALFILVYGFKHGTFTKHKLEEFVNSSATDFHNARKCINRLDKAKEIKELAIEWQGKL